MKKRYMLVALVAVFAVGCQRQQQTLQNSQGMAVRTALNHARFDMNCSSATRRVSSTNVSEPSVQGPLGGTAYGVQRLEYTVGVRGCGQRRTYIVICPQGSAGCFAAQAPPCGTDSDLSALSATPYTDCVFRALYQ